MVWRVPNSQEACFSVPSSVYKASTELLKIISKGPHRGQLQSGYFLAARYSAEFEGDIYILKNIFKEA